MAHETAGVISRVKIAMTTLQVLVVLNLIALAIVVTVGLVRRVPPEALCAVIVVFAVVGDAIALEQARVARRALKGNV